MSRCNYSCSHYHCWLGTFFFIADSNLFFFWGGGGRGRACVERVPKLRGMQPYPRATTTKNLTYIFLSALLPSIGTRIDRKANRQVKARNEVNTSSHSLAHTVPRLTTFSIHSRKTRRENKQGKQETQQCHVVFCFPGARHERIQWSLIKRSTFYSLFLRVSS